MYITYRQLALLSLQTILFLKDNLLFLTDHTKREGKEGGKIQG
jgi:hypothetical protein